MPGCLAQNACHIDIDLYGQGLGWAWACPIRLYNKWLDIYTFSLLCPELA